MSLSSSARGGATHEYSDREDSQGGPSNASFLVRTTIISTSNRKNGRSEFNVLKFVQSDGNHNSSVGIFLD